jgi:hypothetical protein
MLVHHTHVVCCALCTPHHTCIYMYVVPEPHLMHVYMYNPTSFSNLLDFIRFEQPCTCIQVPNKLRHDIKTPHFFQSWMTNIAGTPYLLHHKRKPLTFCTTNGQLFSSNE